MADEPKPADANLADLVAKSLKKVGGTVFSTPTSSNSPKSKASSATLVREIAALKQPLGVTCIGDDVLVLDRPDANRFRIQRHGAEGKAAGTLCEIAKGNSDGELMEPVSLVADAEGQLFIVDARDSCIKKFSAEGRWLDTYRSAGPTGKLFDNPLDVAVDEAGNLLIADANNNRIVQLQGDGELGWILERFPASTGSEEDEFYEPCSVCVGRGGIIRVADRNENRVLGFDATRKLVGAWNELSFPSLVRIASDGTSVFVAERSRIMRYGPSGAVTASIAFPFDIGNGAEANGGGAMTVDAKGNLLVIDPVRESVLVLNFS